MITRHEIISHLDRNYKRKQLTFPSFEDETTYMEISRIILGDCYQIITEDKFREITNIPDIKEILEPYLIHIPDDDANATIEEIIDSSKNSKNRYMIREPEIDICLYHRHKEPHHVDLYTDELKAVTIMGKPHKIILRSDVSCIEDEILYRAIKEYIIRHSYFTNIEENNKLRERLKQLADEFDFYVMKQPYSRPNLYIGRHLDIDEKLTNEENFRIIDDIIHSVSEADLDG